MKVGVVMPVYHQVPDYVRECMQSMERQTFRNFELMIVIDGANEETVQEVRTQAESVTFPVNILHRAENKGIAYSLNEGFANLPHNQYYTWISSDNSYYPDFLATLVEALDRDPSAPVLAYSLYDLMGKDGQSDAGYNESMKRQMADHMNRPKEQIRQISFIGASFLFRKETFHKLGGYNPAYEKVEDYEFMMRLCREGEIRFVNRALMAYRVDGIYAYTTTTSREEINLLSARARRDTWRAFDPLPKVTVIVSAYNHESYIRECLTSVLSQTYRNFQLIAIDDGSQDETWDRIYQMKDERMLPIHIDNRGKSAAFNLALEYALGEYVLELDADDWLEPTALEVLVSHMDRLPETYGMAYGDRMLWFQDRGVVYEGPVQKARTYHSKYEVLSAMQTHCPRFYRTSALRNIGGWPETIRGHRLIAEDLQIMLNIAERYKLSWIPRVLYHQRRHDKNLTLTETVECQRQLEWIVFDSLARWGHRYVPRLHRSNGILTSVELVPRRAVKRRSGRRQPVGKRWVGKRRRTAISRKRRKTAMPKRRLKRPLAGRRAKKNRYARKTPSQRPFMKL